MGRYEDFSRDARVLITDLSVNSTNANTPDCHLKMKSQLESLQVRLQNLDNRPVQRKSVFNKLKDFMTEDDFDKESEVSFSIAWESFLQLELCKKCRCSNCALMDESCRCDGCIYGAYVVSCKGDDGDEIRQTENNLVQYDAMTVEQLTYNRTTKQTTATIRNRNGIECKYALDLATGQGQLL